MNILKRLGICLFFIHLLTACSDFLESVPQGTVSSEDLNSAANLDKLVITAYSSLANDPTYSLYILNWGYDLRIGDAHKGGAGLGDLGDFHHYETFVTNQPDNWFVNSTWVSLYAAVSKVNEAILRIQASELSIYPLRNPRLGEMHFLRGVYYLQLKQLFKHIPWITETASPEQQAAASNREFSSDELYTKIAEEFRTAIGLLPESQDAPGRPTKSTARAYLAKTLLNQAYVQDEETHQLLRTDRDKLSEVVTLTQQVIPGYELFDDFGKNFLTAYDNGSESVFAVQFSMNDGTTNGKAGVAHHGVYPMNSEYGCCGLYVPSQNLLNSFKTDENGLPKFDSYDQEVMTVDYARSHNIDPRLNHTAAFPGVPFKYEPAFIYQESWARSPGVYGVAAPLKQVVSYNDPTYRKYPFGSAKNWPLVRLADVILWEAEALIQLDRETEALPLINLIRERAAKSTDMLVTANGAPIARYKVGTYQPGVNCTWTRDFALKALMWERRLELALEYNRFFDLVRWGTAAEYLNAYFDSEKSRRPYLASAAFQKGRDEYLPIPLNQINFSKGLYKQNNGY